MYSAMINVLPCGPSTKKRRYNIEEDRWDKHYCKVCGHEYYGADETCYDCWINNYDKEDM